MAHVSRREDLGHFQYVRGTLSTISSSRRIECSTACVADPLHNHLALPNVAKGLPFSSSSSLSSSSLISSSFFSMSSSSSSYLLCLQQKFFYFLQKDTLSLKHCLLRFASALVKYQRIVPLPHKSYGCDRRDSTTSVKSRILFGHSCWSVEGASSLNAC